jgi:hypothetical protein
MPKDNPTLIYLPLESYEERYTSQLCKWNTDRFEERGIDFVVVHGKDLREDDAINVGQVLDAHGRSYYSMHQMSNLVSLLHDGKYDCNDVIFSEDMFAPGYAALPYILSQLPPEQRPKVFTRCLAQSIDPDDFVHPMRNWMRHFEMLVDRTVDGILMANTEMGPHMRIAMFDAPLYVTGLPFDKNEVRERIDNEIPPLEKRQKRVVFSSRWDKEKQPWFYMDLIERFYERDPDHGIEFCVTTGAKGLRSTNQEYLDRARKMEEEGKLKIYQGLPKTTYYHLLANSQVQFNCARQDWQSNTLNEASALGTFSLCPAFRSFPEALNNNEMFLYAPWSIEDAYEKMQRLLEEASFGNTWDEISYPADEMHKTIDRTIDIMFGLGDFMDYAFDNHSPNFIWRADHLRADGRYD